MKTLATRATPAQVMLDLLAAQVGQFITVRNRDDAESTDGPRVRFALHGRLEGTEEAAAKDPVTQGSEWYLRAGESYHGPTGIHFPQSRIYAIEEGSTGHVEVILI